MSRSSSDLDWSLLGDDVTEATVVESQGAQESEPWYAAVLKTSLPVIMNTYQQQQLTKLNIERMRQGLPPISAATYANQYMVPTAQVQVGPTEQMQKMMLYGAIGIGALIFLRSRKMI